MLELKQGESYILDIKNNEDETSKIFLSGTTRKVKLFYTDSIGNKEHEDKVVPSDFADFVDRLNSGIKNNNWHASVSLVQEDELQKELYNFEEIFNS